MASEDAGQDAGQEVWLYVLRPLFVRRYKMLSEN